MTRAFTTILVLLALAPFCEAGTNRGKVNHPDAVVYIERIPGKTFAAPSEPVIIDQLNLRFVPHVLVILSGTEVSFSNSDEIRHNVFTPGNLDKFNLGTYPTGMVISRVFGTPGVVTLLCNIHLEMSAYILVLETPYFAVSDNNGNYMIPDVPSGTYVVKTWHERLKPESRTVEVTDSRPAIADFQLKR